MIDKFWKELFYYGLIKNYLFTVYKISLINKLKSLYLFRNVIFWLKINEVFIFFLYKKEFILNSWIYRRRVNKESYQGKCQLF
jgi:hypothetical protein